ncbi:TPA: hypothetical protein ACPE2G_004383 [Citrobacter braakii]
MKTKCGSGKNYTDIGNLIANIDKYIPCYNHEKRPESSTILNTGHIAC